MFASAAVLVACQPTPGKPVLPTTVGQASASVVATRQPPVLQPPTPPAQPSGATAVGPTPFFALREPAAGAEPTLADLWAGRAHFAVDVADTGLPMGESDTIVMGNGELWSFVHASARSAGVVDQCGAAVEFPGCLVIYRSFDDGLTFRPDLPPVCQIPCASCPCTAEGDHVTQQQYPRVHFDGERLWLVYEYLGRVMHRSTLDSRAWSAPHQVADSLVWHLWHRDCPAEERIGAHPFVPFDYECLRGGPPGLIVDDGLLYIFMAQGQNPGALGCFYRRAADEEAAFQPCQHNPLIVGAADYGGVDVRGPVANVFFDFRTVSSAEVVKIGDGAAARFYVLYEGVRGPGPGDAGDTQFGLGLARSLTSAIDGPWEKYPGNPLLADLPGNIGLGHADLVELGGRTYLYTALDGERRSRLVLVWND
jgi:hypothetical protein